MDAKFHPAIAAINSGDLGTFEALVNEDPTLATSRSSRSHPTLLQCVALDGKDKSNNVEMARVLIEAGAVLNEPFVACASMNNRAVAEVLLESGAAIDGTGGWLPIEEALYWNSQDVLALLLERGAKVQNLRIAAGLGRPDLIERYFNDDGSLKPEAGKINWPWVTWRISPARIKVGQGSKAFLTGLTPGCRTGRASSTTPLSSRACTVISRRRSCFWKKASRLTLCPEDLITRVRGYITPR